MVAPVLVFKGRVVLLARVCAPWGFEDTSFHSGGSPKMENICTPQSDVVVRVYVACRPVLSPVTAVIVFSKTFALSNGGQCVSLIPWVPSLLLEYLSAQF